MASKKHGQYPAKLILNPKYKDFFKSKLFIAFLTKRPPTIAPLPINGDINASAHQGYDVDIEYDEGVDEKTLICKGFAKLSCEVGKL